MDDLILPGGRRRLVARPGQAMQINRVADTRIRVDDVDVVFPGEDPVVILPLDLWVRTLARAIATEQQAIEKVSRQTRRQMARNIAKDARN